MLKRLSLLIAVFGIIASSCHKDFPLPQQLCQIKQIVRQGGPTLTGTFNYTYNSVRQLTLLDHSFAFQEDFQFEYDAQGRPVTISEGSLVKNKLIYQNGLVIQIDRFDENDQLFDQAFFTYDNNQRLIERKGFSTDNPLTIYEYEGQSLNPKRKLIYGTPIPTPGGKKTEGASLTDDIPEGLELQIIYEYTYDNKLNPQTTLVGQPLSPFYYGQESVIDMFEPISRNNIVYQKFLRKSGTEFFNYQEYFITYTYDNLYPVTESHRKVVHNLDTSIPPIEIFGSATYSYECLIGNDN